MSELAKVMLVDDESNLLSGLRRQLRGRYDLTTATSGDDALSQLSEKGPFAVVVSDMRMPGMSGVELLNAVGDKDPLAVKMMLTGNADQDTAVQAINEGHIFRFFNKPCDAETLGRGIDEGIAQHKLQRAEKDLIETTLAASVKLLSDIVSMSHPEIAAECDLKRGWARRIAKELSLPRVWELDLAVMLAPIGIVGVPSVLWERAVHDAYLEDHEKAMVEMLPKHGADLVQQIPRLQNVAKGILYQNKNFDGSGFPEDDVAEKDIPLIGRILRVLGGIMAESEDNAIEPAVFDRLRQQIGNYDEDILSVAKRVLTAPGAAPREAGPKYVVKEVSVALLRPGVQLVADMTYEDGHLILGKGCVLNDVQVKRVRALHAARRIAEPIKVAFAV